MAFRHLFIEHRAHISQKQNNLIINVNNYPYNIPLEDIETLIIDNLESSITTNALSKLSLNKVLVLICNKKHLPCFLGLPINNYFHRLPVIIKQFKLPRKVQKRLWQKIIKQKIGNEISALLLVGKTDLQDLVTIRKNVTPGDSKHCEAIAARIYFQDMFGNDFIRRNGNVINGALNYGYSLVRSLIARDICSYGLEPSLGLFHHNMLNSFNLADDLIEPFRSVVDLFVYSNLQEYNRKLTNDNRENLLNILCLNTLIDGKLQSLTNAIHIEVSSYNKCMLKQSSRLILPKLVKLKEHVQY